MKWGIYDATDNVWLGDDTTSPLPKLFDNEPDAKLACMIMDVRLNVESGRHKAKEFPKSKLMYLKDEIIAKCTSLEALDKIEKGFIPKK